MEGYVPQIKSPRIESMCVTCILSDKSTFSISVFPDSIQFLPEMHIMHSGKNEDGALFSTAFNSIAEMVRQEPDLWLSAQQLYVYLICIANSAPLIPERQQQQSPSYPQTQREQPVRNPQAQQQQLQPRQHLPSSPQTQSQLHLHSNPQTQQLVRNPQTQHLLQGQSSYQHPMPYLQQATVVKPPVVAHKPESRDATPTNPFAFEKFAIPIPHNLQLVKTQLIKKPVKFSVQEADDEHEGYGEEEESSDDEGSNIASVDEDDSDDESIVYSTSDLLKLQGAAMSNSGLFQQASPVPDNEVENLRQRQLQGPPEGFQDVHGENQWQARVRFLQQAPPARADDWGQLVDEDMPGTEFESADHSGGAYKPESDRSSFSYHSRVIEEHQELEDNFVKSLVLGASSGEEIESILEEKQMGAAGGKPSRLY